MFTCFRGVEFRLFRWVIELSQHSVAACDYQFNYSPTTTYEKRVLDSLTQEYIRLKNLEKITNVKKPNNADTRLRPLDKLVVVGKEKQKADLEPLWQQLELQNASVLPVLSRQIAKMTEMDVKVVQKSISHLNNS